VSGTNVSDRDNRHTTRNQKVRRVMDDDMVCYESMGWASRQ